MLGGNLLEVEKEKESELDEKERVDRSRFRKLMNRVDGCWEIGMEVLFRLIEVESFDELETWISKPRPFWIWNRNLRSHWIFMSANGSEDTSKGLDSDRGNDSLLCKNLSR